MSDGYEPLQTADLPQRRLAFWQMTGPGAVLVGLSIGAGELVVWPGIAAKYGASMVWAAVIGVFLQLWVNLEVGRWTIATGETAYTGFGRVWRGLAWAFIAFNVFSWIMPGWARISGAALKALFFGPMDPKSAWYWSDTFWTALTFVAVALTLFGPKRIYVAVERTVGVLVTLITLGLIFIAFRVGTWDTVKELGRGIVNVGFKEKGFPAKELFSALVFAGAGGTANLFYSFYLRDKHIGMGARVPALLNPFRKREEKAVQAGYIYPDTPENAARFKDWFRYIMLDQTLYFWLLNTFTILLFIFGALAALHGKTVPAAGQILWDEANILAGTMGEPGRILFLLIGLATLFTTQITLVDGVARSLSDILSHGFKFSPKSTPEARYAFWAIFLMVAGVTLTWFMETSGVTEMGFLFNAGYIGGFAMAVYCPTLLFMNLRALPKSARPKPLNIVMMSVASLVYVGFAVFCIWGEITKRMGG